MVACDSDNYYICERLIAAGADLDLLDPVRHQSALMIAAGKESVYTARLLVSEGADLDLKDYRYVRVHGGSTHAYGCTGFFRRAGGRENSAPLKFSTKRGFLIF